MPRYLLELEYESGERLRDIEGSEVPDQQAAMAEADRGIRELIAATIVDRRQDLPMRIIVVDDRGRDVGVITSRDVIPEAWRV